MAPVEPDVANSNTIPLLRFGAEAVSAGALLVYIGARLYQTAQALPVSQDTRRRVPQRNRDIAVLAALSAFSLAVVSFFAIDRRLLSYNLWAEQSGQDVPNSIWSGWYGTGEDGLGWQLGRWYSDVDITREGYEIAVHKSRSLWWTQQQFTGLLTFSIFAGIEGGRRNLPKSLIFAYVLLAQVAGLSTAQNLFFISLLLTPTPLPGQFQRSPDWVPHLAVYIAPLVSSLISFDLMQYALEHPWTLQLWKAGYYIVPWLFATGIPLLPATIGKTHEDTLTARQSYSRIFYWLSIMAFVLHGKQTASALLENTPPASSSRYNFVWSTHHTQERSIFQRSITAISKVLNAISDHPAVSVVGWDVILSGMSLVVWASMRSLDVHDMLECSAFPWLQVIPSDLEGIRERIREFSVEPAKEEEERDTTTEPETPKPRRGRPRGARKTRADSEAASTANSPTTKKSTRRRTRASHAAAEEEDKDYAGDSTKGMELASTSHGEAYGDEDLMDLAEASALAWGLFVVGGLGVVASSVLGAEVRGR